MAAPIGNNNASKARVWKGAIERALDKRGVDRKAALDALAEKLLAKCEEGDMTALKELGDRLDGKPNQSTEVTLNTVTSDRMTDDELADIAAGSSNRASEQKEVETPLH